MSTTLGLALRSLLPTTLNDARVSALRTMPLGGLCEWMCKSLRSCRVTLPNSCPSAKPSLPRNDAASFLLNLPWRRTSAILSESSCFRRSVFSTFTMPFAVSLRSMLTPRADTCDPIFPALSPSLSKSHPRRSKSTWKVSSVLLANSTGARRTKSSK